MFYAIVFGNEITHLENLATDAIAQGWHAKSSTRGKLVVLDLADGEKPDIGDSVEVDSDGVATLIEPEEPISGIIRERGNGLAAVGDYGVMSALTFAGTRDDLCNAIAAELQRLHARGLNAAVGLRSGYVDYSTTGALDVVLVEQSAALDSYGAADPFTDEIREGIAACFRTEWLTQWEINNGTYIRFQND